MLAQRSFDELGTPLAEVTFCIVDLETTGGSPTHDAITEIGAMKVCRGDVIGTFETLVSPGRPVPAVVRMLTGIDDALLADAPPVTSVLPAFLEFLGGAVIVAHNARFDVGFLDAALTAEGYEPLGNRVVDTAVLARRILAGEAPNHRLETLARHLRCAHRPCHRAFQDVLATTDLLHALIERVSGFGVTTLEDLLSVSRSRLDGTFAKIALTRDLPRAPGVYRFVGAGGATLYVGKAVDIRSRVRSYFQGDARRQVRALLAEVQEIRAEPHATMLEAEVAEARAIASERPVYNRAGKRVARWYLKLALTAPVPRLGAASRLRAGRDLYLGPMRSRKAVDLLLDGLRDALPLHRCRDPAKCRPCPLENLGTCAGRTQRAEVRRAATALVGDMRPVLDVLAARMKRLAAAGRFEEAAEVRDRAAALERVAFKDAEVRALRDAGDVVLRIGRRAVLITDGRLAAATDADDGDDPVPILKAAARRSSAERAEPHEGHAETPVIAAWLRRARDARLVAVSGAWAHPIGIRPPGRFKAAERKSSL